MKRWLVLADDLTGAAEIAGIGAAHGLKACVIRQPAAVDGDLVVMDTDSRMLSAALAGARVKEMLGRQLAVDSREMVFKKVDSVLRGQIGAELHAILEVIGKRRALLVAQNPSKGRVIVPVGEGGAELGGGGGEYRTDGVPLDRTSFRDDPEYPRTSARVEKLIESPEGASIRCARIGDAWMESEIVVGCAQSVAEVEEWARGADADSLLAGGADFFRALLETRGLSQTRSTTVRLEAEYTLMVCGSAAAYSRGLVADWVGKGLGVCLADGEVFAAPREERSIASWAGEAREIFQKDKRLVLAIPQAVEPGRSGALRRCMAGVVRRLVEEFRSAAGKQRRPICMLIEGGATAAAVAEELEWERFAIVGNVGPGVVAMHPLGVPEVLLVIKPGSYPWPAACQATINSSGVAGNGQ